MNQPPDYKYSTDHFDFTHIEIKKIVKNRAYYALFHMRLKGQTLSIETTINGISVVNTIEKTETYIGVKLTEDQYTLPK